MLHDCLDPGEKGNVKYAFCKNHFSKQKIIDHQVALSRKEVKTIQRFAHVHIKTRKVNSERKIYL